MRKLLSQALALVVTLAAVGTAYAAPVKAHKATQQREVVKHSINKKDAKAYKELDLAKIEKQEASRASAFKANGVAKVQAPVFRDALNPTKGNRIARSEADPIIPPFTEDFSDINNMSEWWVIDANGDEKVWGLDTSVGAAVMGYNSSLDMDDWLVTPEIKFEAGVIYPLSIKTWAQSATFPERIEVCVGTDVDPAAMTITVIPATDIAVNKDNAIVLEGEITVPSTGIYYIGIHGISDADKYKLFVDDLTVGAATSTDAPAAIADLAANADNASAVVLSFTAPSTTSTGAALSSLTKIEIQRNGETIGTIANPTPGAALTYTDTTNPGGMTTYTVIASSADGDSKPASVTLFVGALVPPFEETFTDASAIEPYTVIDANGDGVKWTLVNGAMRMSYHSTNAQDDWFVTPPIAVEAGASYQFTMKAYANSSSYPERVEVMMGTAPTAAAMTKTVIPATDITVVGADNAVTLSGFVSNPTDGKIYIGIHGISDANMYFLFIDDISLSAPMDGGAPAAVSDLVATPDPMGALKAVITFTVPTLNIADQPVDAITEVEIYNGANLIATKTDVAAGDQVTYTDLTATQGMNTYSVIVKNALGESVPASTTVFVGVPAPKDVEEASVAPGENDGQVILSWTPVTESIYDTALDPSLITYTILDEDFAPVVEGITGTSYALQVCDPEADPDFYNYFVAAVTDGGMSNYYAGVFFAAGKPLGLPYIESFADGGLSYPMAAVSDGGYISVDFDSDETYQGQVASVDGDNGFIEIYDPLQGWMMPGWAGLQTLPIAIPEDSNPAFTLSVFNIAEDDENYAEIQINGETVKTIYPNEGSMEWKSYSVDLAPYKGQTISVTIIGHLEYYTTLFLDNIAIINVVDNEVIATGITAPTTVKANTEFKVDVKVQNAGSVAQSPTVKLYCNDEEVATATANTLAFLETQVVSFTQTLTPVSPVENVYYAVVEGEDTDDTNNTTAEVTVILNVPNYPTPTELVANGSADEITLTWDEPAAAAGEKQPVTEDFEEAEGFTSNVTNWTILDEDGGTWGSIEGIDMGVTSAGWLVLDNSDEETYNQSFASHSGHKYLITMFNYPAVQQSDWLISPALSGDAQTISFWAKSYTDRYGMETVKVLYSTTDKETSSFTEVWEKQLPADWTEYTAELPEGAKYFAIVCVSNDVFMTFLDDVTYIPADAETVELELKGYNVYRDGVLITETPVEDTTYVDTDVESDTKYSYVVTAVYTQGESAGSNVAEASTTSAVKGIASGIAISTTSRAIIVANAEGENITISAIDGKVIYNAAGQANNMIPAAKGVYVVKVGKTIAKVIVR